MTKAKKIIQAQNTYIALGNKGQFIKANEQIPAMKDAKEYIKQITEALKEDYDNDKIILTDDERNFMTNLSFAYQNYKDTTKVDDQILEFCDNTDGTQTTIMYSAPGTVLLKQQNATNLEENNQKAILAKKEAEKLNAQQQEETKVETQAVTINEIKTNEKTKFTAQPEVQRKLSTWGVKHEPVSGTSSLTSNKERNVPERLKREGSIGSISRLSSDVYERRDRKGSSTQRTYFNPQSGASYTSRHDKPKEAIKRLKDSMAASKLSNTGQLQKREDSVNKKLGGMGFGK